MARLSQTNGGSELVGEVFLIDSARPENADALFETLRDYGAY